MWLVRIKSSYIQVEVYFVHKHQSSLTEGCTCVIFIFIHKYRHFSTQSIFHQSNRCSSRHRQKRIIAFMTGKLSCLDGWRFNLSLAAVSYKHVLPLVDCVWPAGFKIVPGKLIICTEQQWKPWLIFLLHIRGWTRHRGPYQHNESAWRFNDDASLPAANVGFFVQNLRAQTESLICAGGTGRRGCGGMLYSLWPLDGIVTLRCAAPPSDDRPP